MKVGHNNFFLYKIVNYIPYNTNRRLLFCPRFMIADVIIGHVTVSHWFSDSSLRRWDLVIAVEAIVDCHVDLQSRP